MVSAPKFDPYSGQPKMGQIWVNSQTKAKTTPELRGSEVVFYCRFFGKKQCYPYNGYPKTGRESCQYPTKRQEKTLGNKTWSLRLQGQDLNLQPSGYERWLDITNRPVKPFLGMFAGVLERHNPHRGTHSTGRYPVLGQKVGHCKK